MGEEAEVDDWDRFEVKVVRMGVAVVGGGGGHERKRGKEAMREEIPMCNGCGERENDGFGFRKGI